MRGGRICACGQRRNESNGGKPVLRTASGAWPCRQAGQRRETGRSGTVDWWGWQESYPVGQRCARVVADRGGDFALDVVSPPLGVVRRYTRVSERECRVWHFLCLSLPIYGAIVVARTIDATGTALGRPATAKTIRPWFPI